MQRKKNRNQQGQISVLIGVMMMTFLLFFAFVINTGMLVNARINIQNAADLAAYSGAAVQARQLTYISYLNYEMRRQWKKFLFRVYVIGNMAQPSFVHMGQGAPIYVKFLGRHPVTCVIFDPQDNYCQVDSTPPLEGPPESIGNLDAMTNTLRATMQTLNNIQIQKCMALASANQMLNSLWLLNSDPKLSFLQNLPPQTQIMGGKIAGVATGLGLIPREILLRARIKTLESYVNSPPQTNVTLGQAKALSLAGSDPASVERTVQAFYSAFYTLGNFTFPAETIELTELTPPSLLTLREINTGPFSIYAMGRALSTEGSSDGQTAHCVNQDVPMQVANGVVVGVSKDPSILTYYAVRLKAKARLLFNPLGAQGDLQLKAYAAAQPFGSRIGPPAESVQFTHSLLNGGPIPNAAILKDETVGEGTGFDNYGVLGPMCIALNNCQGKGNLTYDDILNGYAVAMAPNPWEEDKYNIINDLDNADGFIRNFGIDDFANIWAPIVPLGASPQEVQQTISQQIREIFSPSVVSTKQDNDAKAPLDPAILGELDTKLQQYVAGLNSPGGGEDAESLNVARISNPYRSPPLNGYSALPGSIITQDRSSLSTSWNDVKDGVLEQLGRIGYSIKFVSFASLNNGTITPSNWNKGGFVNGLTLDTESQLDVPALEH